MEARTLKTKKGAISKGKIKKNIKNVLCRPDPVLWPQITEEEGKSLEQALIKHKIDIPEFKKSHWNELKSIPKEQRPKPPKLEKIDGLFFGIRECKEAIQSGQCAAIIIEASVNPRMIVQPVIELCTEKDVPVLCLSDLRKISLNNFGILTSCLGVKCDSLLNLINEILRIAKSYPRHKKTGIETEKMEISEGTINVTRVQSKIACPYLYRTSKKSRVFIPNQTNNSGVTRKFIGQDFIKLSGNLKNSKDYIKMILKRVSNNADRVKK